MAELSERTARAKAGGSERYHRQIEETGKIFVRSRLDILLDPGSFVENGLLARTMDEGLAADAVVTGTGTVGGRTVAVIANDPTVKAGAWGRETIRKIIRQQEEAALVRCPLLYLVDSAGARLDEQFDLFIDRHHAGRIFWNQARLSGQIPQICVLFGPSPAGAAYLPAFCDAVVMVDGNASAFLGSPRMVEMATGEKVSAEEMGGARMHCEVSGLGDQIARNDEHGLRLARQYLEYLPDHAEAPLPVHLPMDPVDGEPIDQLIPQAQNRAFDVMNVIRRLIDADSFFEHRALFARELVTGFARLDGKPVGLVANQPMRKGGTIGSDASEKGAQFVQLCDAYGIPLVFLSDTPGFMVGSQVERQGIIRRGAKYLAAIAEASVPRISVILRKSYGAGYMAMSGATFAPDATIGLAHAKLAIMGPEAAINAIYLNKINAIEDEQDRADYVAQLRADYMVNLDVFRAASATYLDAVIAGSDLRAELVNRLERYSHKSRERLARRHPVIRG
ncbi:acyl-CoA carboxylase subunit beta [Klenkia sp. PcliD-1-E]|uniref:acyl-CoA carboxylase subunit beta n=1 Tax=Klenkia sp. PcliD-1-E TaxID=2954492 RepID=UPI0020969AAA|nr:acyl-CoA carboxylase subunit beta [Klenkia sp. PcliD-1-E]MCO7218554.1 acyl-CoA carboxylase subunit beta [Klenkia sp. PcliD-1-E]